jgi:parvulin-like peptidyl-prolyl isomerase
MTSITKLFSTVGRWVATALFCVSAIAFVWQGAFFSSPTAMAAPGTLVIAAATDTGEQIQRDNKALFGMRQRRLRTLPTATLKKLSKQLAMMVALLNVKLKEMQLALRRELMRMPIGLRERSTTM